MSQERSIDKFERDVAEHGGYLYTGERLSCRLANGRISRAVREFADVVGKSVVDVGCGDGTYTRQFAEAGATDVLGVDAAEEAVQRARRMCEDLPQVDFRVVDIYSLDDVREHYDIAVVRGLLHHLYDVRAALRGLCRLADRIVVVEPNGFNPVLKVIEKVSPYHLAHEEKSYRPTDLDRWFEQQGGHVARSMYIGFVPFFCPDWMARACKRLEPLIERIPALRMVSCGQYVQDIRVRQR